MNKIRNSTFYKGCVHKDEECDGITSKAHSIQNHGYLDDIATDGEVLCIDFGKFDKGNDFPLNKVGKNKASIFTGFCNHHDSTIFRPIEDYDYDPNNIEQNYLFAYRAFALAYFERNSSCNFRQAWLKIKKEKGENTESLQKDIANYKKHLELIERLRISMNTNLDNKRFNRICTEVLIWPQDYKIAATSMFFIYKDKEGNIINNPPGYLSPFFFTIIPHNNKTFVLMSYLAKDKSIYKFIKSQIVDTDISEQKMLISNILSMNVENFFISPDKWESFPIETRNIFIEAHKLSFVGKRPRMGYFKDLNLFV
jgi:hypothetical protein